MMEWGDIGIKEPNDVRMAMRNGASAQNLLQSYGDRIAGLIAEALEAELAGARDSLDDATWRRLLRRPDVAKSIAGALDALCAPDKVG